MKERLILFVHGLGGDAQATWRAPGRAGFAELIGSDAALSSEADVQFFSYPTTLLRLPFSSEAPRVRDLAEGLRSQLELRYKEYKSIALVCHSLGGLVARKYLVEEAKRSPHSKLRVDKLLLLAVPNLGSALAPIARHISWRHNQLRQLCRDSEFIEELNTDWATFMAGKELDVQYVVAGQDRVVDKHSAIKQWGNENVHSILGVNHVSIAKPCSHDDDAYRILRRFVLGKAPVFLSVGGGRNEAQEVFVARIKEFMGKQGLAATTVDEYSSTNKQPFRDVEHRMSRCYGAVVLAFERTHVEAGVSRRGAPLQAALKDVSLPPVWNHIEAAMAHTRRLPLLVLLERGLQQEGMLEEKYDWRVKSVDVRENIVDDRDFLGMFEDWRSTVINRRDASLHGGQPVPGL